MKQGEMMKRRGFFITLLMLCLLLAGSFILVRTPVAINKFGSFLRDHKGFDFKVRDFSVSPSLRATISGLEFERMTGGLAFASTGVSAESSLRTAARGEIEKLVLKGPRFSFHLGPRKKKKRDLSFLEKLVPVRLLTVEKGEVDLLFHSLGIRLTNLDLELHDFSSKNGGVVTFQGIIDVVWKEEVLLRKSRCKGRFVLTRVFPKPVGKGVLEIEATEGAIGPIRQKETTLRIAATLDREMIHLSAIDIFSGRIDVVRSSGPVQLQGATVKGDLTFEYPSRALYSKAFECRIQPIGIVKGNFRMTATGEKPWKAFIETDRIDFAHIFAFLKPVLKNPGANAWSIQGKGAAEARLEGRLSRENPHFEGSMVLRFREGGFSSDDGRKVGQNIDGAVTLQFNKPSATGKGRLDLTSEIRGGEYLFGAFYRDLRGERLQMSSRIELPSYKSGPFQFEGTLNLLDTGAYSYDGSVNGNQRVISFRADDISHERAAAVILRDYLAERTPRLKDMKMGGRSSFLVKIAGNGKDVQLNGSVRTTDLFLAFPYISLSFDRVGLDLPFSLSFPPSSLPPADMPAERSGMLHIGTFEGKRIGLHDIDIPLILQGNTLSIAGPVDLETPGAKVRIDKCAVDNILSPERTVALALSMKDIRLDHLFPELTAIRFLGSMEADFPLITYEEGWWTMRGKTTVKLFGGEMDAIGISASSLFSHSRTIRGNLEFRSINLEKATETIKLGKMTGIINGSLRDIEIDYGQPTRFTFDIDSVPTKGVNQKVSVDAIENISFLSTGSEVVGTVLKSGVRRFLKEYPYSRIGIRVTLENDRISLRGKIFEGSKEYMVRRAFLRGVDVVNQNPENKVSFKDMNERLGRIFKKGRAKLIVPVSAD
jgi:hypothetical protein